MLSLLMLSGNSQQSKVIDRIIEIGRTDNRTMHHLDVITNRFGGRPVGSDAYTNAAQWCASEFRKWGMEVIMDEAGSVPVGFNRGPWFGRLLSENGMTLHFATPSYTSGTKGVQRGHVLIEPKTRDEFERMKGALKGAWVLIGGKNDGWPIDYSEKADSAREKVIVYNDSIGKINRAIMFENFANRGKPPKELHPLKEEPALFYREMREAGILGVIQSSAVPIRALYDRKNLDRMTFENLPTVCDIKLDEDQYAIIEKMAKERRYFLLEFDIRNHFKPGPVKYHNVIGVIRGTRYPDEYVMMGGHLDAFDVATGGVDDGSGATPVMEAARLIMAAGGRPQRTILACLWAAEEFGLLGSKHWVETNREKLPRISNYFNRDGGPTVASGIVVPDAMYNDFEKVCKPLNSINPDFPFRLTRNTNPPRPRPTTASSSDHAYFAMNGVPTLSFETPDSKGYNFDYGEIWHTERDTYDKSIPEYQEHTSVVTAVVVYGLANLDHLLSRKGLYLEPEEKK
ncbi:MAG TPA: M28 family peptidase [Bacteroidales bacterium]|nr:M28 family peptidase [Bacteroidales bacterium]HQH23295.1 M28 family peptidase [Bacteroidales bacterium]HQJ82199.1 M28 family peptidase [Bacteroidales bacterium]